MSASSASPALTAIRSIPGERLDAACSRIYDLPAWRCIALQCSVAEHSEADALELLTVLEADLGAIDVVLDLGVLLEELREHWRERWRDPGR
jgi:hypothetical protein